jgi:hypothetical protein
MYFIYLGSRSDEYLLEELIFAQPVMKFPLVWIQKYIAVFTTAHRVVLITWHIRGCINLSCGPAEAGKRHI